MRSLRTSCSIPALLMALFIPTSGHANPTVEESPIACDFGALSEEQLDRYWLLVKELKPRIQAVSETEDGYVFGFAPTSKNIADVAEFIVLERLCCPFLDFELLVAREHESVQLRLGGREGVKPFIRAEFGLE